jgi:hypothetical protein
VETLLSTTKRPMLKVARKRAGGLTIDVLPKSGADAAEMLKAIERLIADHLTGTKGG